MSFQIHEGDSMRGGFDIAMQPGTPDYGGLRAVSCRLSYSKTPCLINPLQYLDFWKFCDILVNIKVVIFFHPPPPRRTVHRNINPRWYGGRTWIRRGSDAVALYGKSTFRPWLLGGGGRMFCLFEVAVTDISDWTAAASRLLQASLTIQPHAHRSGPYYRSSLEACIHLRFTPLRPLDILPVLCLCMEVMSDDRSCFDKTLNNLVGVEKLLFSSSWPISPRTWQNSWNSTPRLPKINESKVLGRSMRWSPHFDMPISLVTSDTRDNKLREESNNVRVGLACRALLLFVDKVALARKRRKGNIVGCVRFGVMFLHPTNIVYCFQLDSTPSKTLIADLDDLLSLRTLAVFQSEDVCGHHSTVYVLCRNSGYSELNWNETIALLWKHQQDISCVYCTMYYNPSSSSMQPSSMKWKRYCRR
mgnify:CR=1 FL=1